MQDQEIKCTGVDRETPCPYGATFIHSVKDQEFYQEKGFEAPKRCRDCREAKKAKKDTQGSQKPRYGGHSENKGHRDSRREHTRRRDREVYGFEGRD